MADSLSNVRVKAEPRAARYIFQLQNIDGLNPFSDSTLNFRNNSGSAACSLGAPSKQIQEQTRLKINLNPILSASNVPGDFSLVLISGAFSVRK